MSEEQAEYETDADPSVGPWEIISYSRPGHAGNDYTVDMAGWECRVADISHTGEIGRANARLIAAAPDMLKALKLCKHQIQEIASQAGHDPGVYKAYTMVEDAIAKAEGEA